MLHDAIQTLSADVGGITVRVVWWRTVAWVMSNGTRDEENLADIH